MTKSRSGPRHWVRSAGRLVRTGTGLVAAWKGLKKKGHSKQKLRHRSSARLAFRKRKHGFGNDPSLSGYATCYDKRVKPWSNRVSKFARKVQGVINKSFATYKYVDEFTGYLPVNSYKTGADTAVPVTNAVGWLQLSLDYLNCGSVINGTYGTIRQEVCGAFDSSYTNTTDGYGLLYPLCAASATLVYPATNFTGTGTVGSGVVSTIYDYVTSMISTLGGASTNQYKVYQGRRSMVMELKNSARACRYHCIIYTVKPRNPNRIRQAVANFDPAAGTGAIGGSPLTTYIRGLVRSGMTLQQIGAQRSWGLTDSDDFNQHYKIVKKCSVILPPGGAITKVLSKKKGRMLNLDYIQDQNYDRNTEYLVLRAYPEHEFGNATAVTTAQANWPGIPSGIPPTVAGSTIFSGGAATGALGTGVGADLTVALSYRYTFKPVLNTIQTDKYTVLNVMPAVNTVAAGTNVVGTFGVAQALVNEF